MEKLQIGMRVRMLRDFGDMYRKGDIGTIVRILKRGICRIDFNGGSITMDGVWFAHRSDFEVIPCQ